MGVATPGETAGAVGGGVVGAGGVVGGRPNILQRILCSGFIKDCYTELEDEKTELLQRLRQVSVLSPSVLCVRGECLSEDVIYFVIVMVVLIQKLLVITLVS